MRDESRRIVHKSFSMLCGLVSLPMTELPLRVGQTSGQVFSKRCKKGLCTLWMSTDFLPFHWSFGKQVGNKVSKLLKVIIIHIEERLLPPMCCAIIGQIISRGVY